MKTLLGESVARRELRTNVTDIDTAFATCGENTGNVVFFDSLTSQICYDEMVDVYNLSSCDSLNSSCMVVIPSSNWITLDRLPILERIADGVKKWDIKICLVGLGCQFPIGVRSVKEFVCSLPKERIDALRVIAYNAESIGVRGAVTAKVFYELGIKNHVEIGCPSFYEPFRKKKIPRFTDKVVHNSSVSIATGSLSASKLLQLAISNESFYIMQEKKDLPLTVYKNMDVTETQMGSRYPNCEISGLDMKKYLLRRGKVFLTCLHGKGTLILRI